MKLALILLSISSAAIARTGDVSFDFEVDRQLQKLSSNRTPQSVDDEFVGPPQPKDFIKLEIEPDHQGREQ